MFTEVSSIRDFAVTRYASLEEGLVFVDQKYFIVLVLPVILPIYLLRLLYIIVVQWIKL